MCFVFIFDDLSSFIFYFFPSFCFYSKSSHSYSFYSSVHQSLPHALSLANTHTHKHKRTHLSQSLIHSPSLTLSHTHCHSGTGDLLTDATLILAPGRRYGLVGRNGAGNLKQMFLFMYNTKYFSDRISMDITHLLYFHFLIVLVLKPLS